MSSDVFSRFLEEIQALIERPTSNLTAASLLLAIVVIAVLVVLIVALLALTSSRRPRARTASVNGSPRAGGAGSPTPAGIRIPSLAPRQVLWASGAIVLLAVIGTYASTSTRGPLRHVRHAV